MINLRFLICEMELAIPTLRVARASDSLLGTFPAPAPPGAWPDLGRRRNRVSQAGQRLSRTAAGTQLRSQSGARPWPRSGSGSSVAGLCGFEQSSVERPRKPGQLSGLGWRVCKFLGGDHVLAEISWDLWAPSPAGPTICYICQMTQPFGTHFPSLEFFPQCSWEEEKKLP